MLLNVENIFNMSNFAKDTPKYRIPEPLKPNWNYVGDGKFHDDLIGHPSMHGRRFTIDYGYKASNNFVKFQQSLKNYVKTK